MGFNPTFYAGRPKLSEVTIDSDLDMGTYLIKTNAVKTDTINEKTAGSGVTIDGPIKTDAINEKTVGNGVVVDGVVCKDGVAVIGL